jgi:hypothetical protein
VRNPRETLSGLERPAASGVRARTPLGAAVALPRTAVLEAQGAYQ